MDHDGLCADGKQLPAFSIVRPKPPADSGLTTQYGGFLMVGGRLGDTFGQELLLKISMVAFNVLTLVCALVSNQVGFLVSRALQGASFLYHISGLTNLIPYHAGVAAAFTIPSAQAMIGHLFPDPKAHALALSWWGATGSMGFVYVITSFHSSGPVYCQLMMIQPRAYHWRLVHVFGLLALGMYFAPPPLP